MGWGMELGAEQINHSNKIWKRVYIPNLPSVLSVFLLIVANKGFPSNGCILVAEGKIIFKTIQRVK